MISDSITNASATPAPTNSKKKRTNRSAKLKQSKLGLRREQWLSQVAMANKDSKRRNGNEKVDRRDIPVENNLDESCFGESLSNSPNSILNGMNSIPSFSSGSSSGSGGGSCSGNVTEDEDVDADDDGCLDDWEAIADALAADEDKHEEENRPDPNPPERESVKSNKAWRADDKLRPQGLPNLEKQCSFPCYSSVAVVPSPCPICYEDLDMTDSNFLPCPCGFRLCLFCHKTICDGDGRCPGCRKAYERDIVKVEATVRQGGGLTIRLARSSSMFCRS